MDETGARADEAATVGAAARPAPDADAAAAIETDAAFEKLFADEIAPKLEAREDKRRDTVRFHNISLAIGIGVAAVLVALVFGLGGPPPLAFFLGVLSLMIGWGVGAAAVHTLKKEVKHAMTQSIAPFLGLSFTAGISQPPGFRQFRELRLVPSYNISSFEDLLEGQHAGHLFELYEAHLKRRTRDSKGRTRTTTVFRGQLVRIAFPRNFDSTTVIMRDAGVFNWMNKPGKELKRVGLVDPHFEKIFEVFGTDQVEARYLLTPSFMERLLALEAMFKGKRVRAAFDGGDLLIAVQGGDLFEAGSMFKPLADISRARTLRDEIRSIHDIIDVIDEQRDAPQPV